MKDNLIAAAVFLYLLIACFTFGHAFNRNKYSDHKYSPGEARMYSAIMCSAGWPLYWSVVWHSKP